MSGQEDTEWNDVLRAKGILPPKEITVTEDELNALVDQSVVDYHEKKLANASLDELDELEDDEDDRVLEMYRRKRVLEMQEAASRRRFGEVIQISKPDFVREVTEASKDVWVVVHLFKDGIPACRLINAILATLAPKHAETKFLKIVGDQCIPGYPDRNMPTLVVYGHGEMKFQLVGIQSFPGGQGCRVQDLEQLLKLRGVIEGRAGAGATGGKEDDDEEDAHAPRYNVRRAEKDEDSDSDWD
ncbi:hypothetical protein AMAG_07149 [Allomyces macrogynus ATCC 38327]|uniref:Phosducin domain-containing protein n=1 Tax=Allomyces macrogynus (strain ATCC 38327) TaxID=578462 RepID=A0A0L0SHF0_ALLM3|nr:hypothetical protein AMAG_07149 [Allomyces macrogynus ATCC 38327]|eukprot:KNE61877.1 hypothetical protein AMAG_07149 [Allomyces macrogynus ATCC 38327]